MGREYIVIQDELHTIINEMTRSSELKVRYQRGIVSGVNYDLTDLFKRTPDRYFELAAAAKDRELPEVAQRSIVETEFFDAARVDPRCSGTFRRFPSTQHALFSIDLLAYGMGVLRLASRPEGILKVGQGRVIDSPHLEIYGHTIANTKYSSESERHIPQVWESTNLIYGDMFGEILQLYDRRNETGFIKDLTTAIHRMAEATNTFKGHNKLIESNRAFQAVWTRTPATARELLERLEYIINRCIVEEEPATRKPGIIMRTTQGT